MDARADTDVEGGQGEGGEERRGTPHSGALFLADVLQPRIPYLAFLQTHATPKLYWPEFRRKHKREPEMRDTKLPDREREKWYREYISSEFYLRHRLHI